MATKNIEDAAKPIQDVWKEIQHEFIKVSPGKYLELTAVYRSPEEQFELFKKGRVLTETGRWVVKYKEQVVTNVDGRKVLGAHNYKPSRAIDVVVVDNQTGKYLWEEKNYFSLGPIVETVGLEWGGSWKSIKDLPHIQIKNYKEYKGA